MMNKEKEALQKAGKVFGIDVSNWEIRVFGKKDFEEYCRKCPRSDLIKGYIIAGIAYTEPGYIEIYEGVLKMSEVALFGLMLHELKELSLNQNSFYSPLQSRFYRPLQSLYNLMRRVEDSLMKKAYGSEKPLVELRENFVDMLVACKGYLKEIISFRRGKELLKKQLIKDISEALNSYLNDPKYRDTS